MGRGKDWDLYKNKILARAWAAASEDAVAGVDQRGKTFYETVHRQSSEKAPDSSAEAKGRYGPRSTAIVRHHVKISPQTCRILQNVAFCACMQAEGITERKMMAMAVLVHCSLLHQSPQKAHSSCSLIFSIDIERTTW